MKIGKPRLISGLSLLILFAANTGRAQGVACSDVFGDQPSEVRQFAETLQSGRQYRLQANGSSNVIRAKLVKVTMENGEPLFEFSEGHRHTLHRLAESEIFDAKPTSPPKASMFAGSPIQLFLKALRSVFLSWDQLHGGLRAQLPLHSVASTPRLRVGSWSPLTNRALARKIADNITVYDLFFEKSGFRIPDLTQIHILDQPWIPRGSPSFFPGTLRKSCIKHSITLSPMNHDIAFVSDPFVHLHERAHSILFATYDPQSRLSTDLTIQEGFADFMAAHYLNRSTPENLKPEFARNLADRSNGGRKLTSLADLNGEPHHDGVFVSTLLWRIREAIGPEAMDRLLPTITDGLNRFKTDEVLFPPPKKSFMEFHRHDEVRRLEEVMAIIDRSTESFPEALTVQRVIADEAKSLSMDTNRLADIRKTLMDGRDPARRKEVKILEIIGGIHTATMGVLIDGAAILGLMMAIP